VHAVDFSADLLAARAAEAQALACICEPARAGARA
jgi:hypothetical protein